MPHQPSDEEQETRFRALLASEDDVALFAEGGCFVFAAALHEVLGYKLLRIPGHSDFATQDVLPVSHLFGLLVDGGEFAVDVKGTRKVEDVMRAFGGTQAVLTSMPELLRWRADPRRGIFAKPWFYDAAIVRARRRIERFRPYFSGETKEMVPGHK